MTKNYVVTVRIKVPSGEAPTVLRQWGGLSIHTRDGDAAKVTWTTRKHKVKKRSRRPTD